MAGDSNVVDGNERKKEQRQRPLLRFAHFGVSDLDIGDLFAGELAG